MIRTQISLSGWEYRQAKATARGLGVSLAELLRRALRQMIPVRRTKRWMQYAGLVSSDNPRSSQEIDDIVYGQKD